MGVIFIILCTHLFITYIVLRAASDQYVARSCSAYHKVCTIVARVVFYCSAFSFCVGLSAPVGSTKYLNSFTIIVCHSEPVSNSLWSILVNLPLSWPKVFMNRCEISMSASCVHSKDSWIFGLVIHHDEIWGVTIEWFNYSIYYYLYLTLVKRRCHLLPVWIQNPCGGVVCIL